MTSTKSTPDSNPTTDSLVEQIARRLTVFRDEGRPDDSCVYNTKIEFAPAYLEARPHAGGCVTYVRWRTAIPEAIKIIELVKAATCNERKFACAARRYSGPDGDDCAWPGCGCDPYADKVIEALQESGALKEHLS